MDDFQKMMEDYLKSGGTLQPTAGDVHVNVPLTNISVAYAQEAMGFVAGRVFPEIPVMHKSNTYYHYPRGWWNRIEMKDRGPATESAGAGYEVSTDTYLCKRKALHHDIDDERRANSDSVLGPDRSATQFLTHQDMLEREKRFVDFAMKASAWTFFCSGTATSADVDRDSAFTGSTAANNQILKWSDDGSSPIADIKLFKRTVQKSTGYRPNILTLGRPVFDTLTEHPDIIDRLNRGQTSGAAQANKDDLMRLLEMDDILVMEGIQNTAKEGATDVHTWFSGEDALLTYRPMSPGLEIPSAGYCFNWTGFIGSSSMGSRITRFRMQELTADRIEIESYFDYKVIGADLGFFMDAIV